VSSVLTPERLDGLVTEMDALTSRVSTLIDDLTGIAATVSDELAATPVAETVTELRAKLVLIDETAAQFGSAAAAVTAAAEGMDQVLDSAPAARAELTRTLVEMENTLAAIRAFVRYLDQDPSSLLRGKQAPSARD
jgi:DNA-binding phage protein